jgi:hypothetical protein
MADPRKTFVCRACGLRLNDTQRPVGGKMSPSVHFFPFRWQPVTKCHHFSVNFPVDNPLIIQMKLVSIPLYLSEPVVPFVNRQILWPQITKTPKRPTGNMLIRHRFFAVVGCLMVMRPQCNFFASQVKAPCRIHRRRDGTPKFMPVYAIQVLPYLYYAFISDDRQTVIIGP